MLHEVDYRKWLLSALVIAHIAWIANHLRLVANDEINPWKLGGYGMYTVPDPNSRYRVVARADQNIPVPIQKRGFDLAQRFTNPARTFRCAPVAPEALRAFFKENRNLIGRDIAIIFSERRFYRTPPSINRELQGGVLVSWPDMNTFTYTNKFCGVESTGSASFEE
jgi:hypothetical protein